VRKGSKGVAHNLCQARIPNLSLSIEVDTLSKPLTFSSLALAACARRCWTGSLRGSESCGPPWDSQRACHVRGKSGGWIFAYSEEFTSLNVASQAWHIVQQTMSETLYGPMMYVAIQSVLSLRFETYVRRLVKHSRFQSEAFFLILRRAVGIDTRLFQRSVCVVSLSQESHRVGLSSSREKCIDGMRGGLSDARPCVISTWWCCAAAKGS